MLCLFNPGRLTMSKGVAEAKIPPENLRGILLRHITGNWDVDPDEMSIPNAGVIEGFEVEAEYNAHLSIGFIPDPAEPLILLIITTLANRSRTIVRLASEPVDCEFVDVPTECIPPDKQPISKSLWVMHNWLGIHGPLIRHMREET
jgi:hypothetical protein